jgi:enoyl-CoA hydratase/carnithine racemase
VSDPVPHLLADLRDNILTLTLTLNRPEKRNALSQELVDHWADELIRARTDEDVHVVVVTGAGSAFCSGSDLQLLRSRNRKGGAREYVHKVAYAMEALDKPVLAAINGPAVGAGLGMALMVDYRLMADTARVAESYISVGIIPGDGDTYYLPKLIGVAQALRLMWTGEFVTAQRALELGLVDEVVPAAELITATMELASKIARGPQAVVRRTERAVYESLRVDLRTALDLVEAHQAAISAERERKPDA